MITTVGSNAGLSAALSSAHAGDTILLAAGTYSQVSLSGVNFAGQVTIASADPSHMAVVQGLSVSNSSGVTFSDLSIAVTSGATGVASLSSTNLIFDSLKVVGPGAAVGGLGFMIADSSNVTVSNSDISALWGGIDHLDSTGLAITGNKLHDLQEDAIRGGGSSNVTISNNFVTNIYPEAGDHPDAIQFWGTSAHPTVQNVSITGNIYERGAGEPAQGIFIADGAYQNVTVTNNAIVGGLYNGIVVGGTDGAVVSGNLVEGYSDQGSWLGVASSNNVQLSGNEATGIVQLSANTNFSETGDTTISSGAVGDTAQLSLWQGGHGTPVPAPPAALVTPPVAVSPPPASAPAAPAASSATETPVVTVAPTVTPEVAAPPTPLPTGDLGGSVVVVSGPFGPITISLAGLSSSGLGSATSSLTQGAALPIPTVVIGKDDTALGTPGPDVFGPHSGAETVSGTGGDDTYYVSDPGDLVVEARNGGTDTVLSSVSTYTLPNQVENLRLIGTSAQSGFGNELNNVLIGNGVNSTLNGGGGDDTLVATGGINTLTGGAGHDVFQFQGLPSNVSTVTDFTPGQDTLDLHPLLGAYQGSNPVADGWVKFQVDATGTTVLVDHDGPVGAGGFVAVAKLTGVTSTLAMGSDWVF